MALELVGIEDFSPGMNRKQDPSQLGPGEAYDAINVWIDTRSVVKRNGMAKWNSNQLPSGTAAADGLFKAYGGNASNATVELTRTHMALNTVSATVAHFVSVNVTSAQKAAMGFKVPFACVCQGLKVALKRTAGNASSLTARIETDTAGNPSGTLVNADATVTQSGPGGGTLFAEWYVEFVTAFALSAATPYHLVIQDAGAGTTYAWRSVTMPETYASGVMKYNAGSWVDTTYRGYFSILGYRTFTDDVLAVANGNLYRTASPTAAFSTAASAVLAAGEPIVWAHWPNLHRTFLSDGVNCARMYDGQYERKMGPPKPPTGGPSVSGGTAVSSNVTGWRVSFVSKDGIESNWGPETGALNYASVTLTGIPTSNESFVTQRRVYVKNLNSPAETPTWILAAVLDDNTTTSMTVPTNDSLPRNDSSIYGKDGLGYDAGIASTGTVSNQSGPPKWSAAAIHRGNLYCGFSDEEPNRLYVSRPGLYETFDDTSLDFESEQGGDPGVVILSLRDELLVLKQASIWKLTGSSLADWQKRLVDPAVGCVARGSAIATPNMALFLSHRGLEAYTGGEYSATGGTTGVTLLSDKIRDILDGLTTAQKALVSATLYKSRYYLLAYPDGAAYNNAVLVFDLQGEQKGWTRFTGWSVRQWLRLPQENETLLFCRGDASGYLMQADTGTSDDTANIAFTWESGDLQFAEGFDLKKILEKVWLEYQGSLDVIVTIDGVADPTLSFADTAGARAVAAMTPITSSGGNTYYHRGRRFRVKLTKTDQQAKRIHRLLLGYRKEARI